MSNKVYEIPYPTTLAEAYDCINVLTLDLDEAARMADIINYFIKVIKQEGGHQ